jgi:KDO2-lipid IV(A) lauroyltransferase
LYRLAGILIPLVPPGVGYPILSLTGRLVFHLAKERREVVMGNLAHVVGVDADAPVVRELAVQVFQNQIKNYFDLFRLPSMDDRQIQGMIKLEGYQNLPKALSDGRGAIMITAHFGNLEVVGQILMIHGHRVTTPAEHLKPEKLFRYICDLRESKGMRMIPVDGPMFDLFRALKRNEIVGLVADRNLNDGGVVVDFFGSPAQMPTGHVELALRTGAPILVAHTLRLHDNSYRGTILPPVELQPDGGIEENLRRVLADVEGFIEQHPEQWVMFEPVWEDMKASAS